MNRIKQTIFVMLLVALAGAGLSLQAQGPSNRQLDQFLRRVESGADTFRGSLDDALNNNYGATGQDEIRGSVSDFSQSLNRLRDRFDEGRAGRADVQDLLDRAAAVDDFMSRYPLTTRAQNDWSRERANLSDLARAFGLNFGGNTVYDHPSAYGQYGPGQQYGDRRLTGTYRLNTSQSDDPNYAADRALRNVAPDRQGIARDDLLRRLSSPDQLAIARRGRDITIASSRAGQFTLVADGQERVEQLPDGHTTHASADLSGDRLTVRTRGDRDSDFSVTFEPINNGRQLRVTRSISSLDLDQPVVVNSIYDRTSDVARFDIYNGARPFPNDNRRDFPNDNRRDNRDFIVRDGEMIVAVLNNDLSTRDSREGDRFTMTVRQPSRLQGATIEGTVSSINRSGRISGRSQMGLNFERIRMPDGRTYNFAGVLDSVRASNGDNIRVDNEGEVAGGNSQTRKTEERGAIGVGVGAIIGAIAGGGKGAAIGAILGGGAGAGSVYAQGRQDVQLLSGTEVTIRASAPDSYR